MSDQIQMFPDLQGEPPTHSCLLICNDVVRSVRSGQNSIEGVVDRITVPDVPALVGPFVAYIRLGNVYSRQKIKFNFCHESDDKAFFNLSTMSPEDSNPLETHTLVVRIEEFEIHQGGRYLFSALHDNVAFAVCPIVVEVEHEGGE